MKVGEAVKAVRDRLAVYAKSDTVSGLAPRWRGSPCANQIRNFRKSGRLGISHCSLLSELRADFPEQLELFQRRLLAGDGEAVAAMSNLIRACVHVIEAGAPRVVH